jgi:hypothetical protein
MKCEVGRAWSVHFCGKPRMKRPLGRLGIDWVHDSKTDLREIGWSDMDWIQLAQNKNQ